MKSSYLWLVAAFALLGTVAVAIGTSSAPEVPYPDGYRHWMHVCSSVIPAKPSSAAKQPSDQNAALHGLIFHVYANDSALEGYRTGHFPEGAVLIADWFFLDEKGGSLEPGTRKSINVMVRDQRYADTGGWGFEDFDRDSHTKRNVGPNALKACYECHSQAKDHEFVFSKLKP
ncbi:MAG TPA: cytochrome P460 family protein [Opitutaceae bacterium]